MQGYERRRVELECGHPSMPRGLTLYLITPKKRVNRHPRLLTFGRKMQTRSIGDLALLT
jgi:hypothetical protein